MILQVVAVDVLAELVEALAAAADADARLTPVRREDQHAVRIIEEMDVHARVRNARPVCVVAEGQRGCAVVLLRLHEFRDRRVQPVGAHDDARPLLNLFPSCPAAHPDHTLAFPDEVAHDEALAQFRARLDRRVDEDLVEDDAPRAQSVGRKAVRQRHIGRLEGRPIEVQRPRLDVRRARLDDLVEQAPVTQPHLSGQVDVVCGHDVAGEAIAVRQKDPVALAREQHRQGRAGYTRANYDRIVHA